MHGVGLGGSHVLLSKHSLRELGGTDNIFYVFMDISIVKSVGISFVHGGEVVQFRMQFVVVRHRRR